MMPSEARYKAALIGDIRAAIERFRNEASPLDKPAEDVLARLTSECWSKHVTKAFEVVPRERWNVLLRDCLSAEKKMRQHRRIAEECQRRVADAKKALSAFKEVTKFVRNLVGSQRDDALQILSVTIEDARRDAESALRELGRKVNEPAARSAGIGWLKQSVRGLSGAPNIDAVSQLAEAVLNSSQDISDGMVRKAKTPRDRLNRALYGAFTPRKSTERAG